MSFDCEQEGYPFHMADELFADTFSEEVIYRFSSEELKIRQVFSANLGVAAQVWDAVSVPHLLTVGTVCNTSSQIQASIMHITFLFKQIATSFHKSSHVLKQVILIVCMCI